ncbi:MAG: M23 family metallopeptidase [Treponema sp.]|nr:M23 family metallopeptidase [Treponema sp.]
MMNRNSHHTAATKRAVSYAIKIISGMAVCFVVWAVILETIRWATRRDTANGVGGLEMSTPHFITETMPAGDITPETDDTSDMFLTYQTYRVKAGDMIGIIADTYGITQDTIISVNGIRQSRLLQIGQYLKIPSHPGVLYTARKNNEPLSAIAKKYEVSLERCAAVNGLTPDAQLAEGTTIFVPDAQLDWATLQEINGDLFVKPLHARWWLSSHYGWRKSPFSGARTFHSGVDMAAAHGTAVYAALSGRVTFTGFNATYGNYIVIAHHSGYSTLYGHLSAITCSKGQYVDTKTLIGRVGNTGLSTGPHLHFTVMKNGKTVNPVVLWK